MGNVGLKIVSKKGKDKLISEHTSLLQCIAKDIDGNQAPSLADVVCGKKCLLVVNVASKWGLTDKNYTQMVRIYKEYRD